MGTGVYLLTSFNYERPSRCLGWGCRWPWAARIPHGPSCESQSKQCPSGVSEEQLTEVTERKWPRGKRWTERTGSGNKDLKNKDGTNGSGEDVEKLEPLCIAHRNGAVVMENCRPGAVEPL